MKHKVCAICGILLDCDWLSICLDYDDICEKTDEDYHNPIEVKCDCKSKVK